MRIFIYTISLLFGLAPSLIWLLFYLRKDAHPEPKRVVLRVFGYGVLLTVLFGIFLSKINTITLLDNFFSGLDPLRERFPVLFTLLYIFLQIFIGIAFVEEFLKYIVVKKIAIRLPDLDEPTDIMLYMIIVALGFAAVENILVIFNLDFPAPSSNLGLYYFITLALFWTSIRFIGATFLHALASGIVGYFLALSFYYQKKHKRLILLGLTIATLLHGFFNLFIILAGDKISEKGEITVPSFVLFLLILFMLSGAGFFVSRGFKKLKKIKGACEINN